MNKSIGEMGSLDLDNWRSQKQAGTFKGKPIELDLAHSKSQPRKQKPSSNATINRAQGVLRAALNRAVKWKIISATDIDEWGPLPTAKTAGKFMTEEEITHLNKELDNWSGYFTVIIKLLLNTGYTLEWTSVDLDNNIITIQAENAKNGYMRTVGINKYPA